MNDTVWILIALLVAILVLMGWKVFGKSLDRLLQDAAREHHHVLEMIGRHPKGGAWRQVRRWMAEND